MDMRIIHIVPSISNEASGPSPAVAGLCASLIKQGQDVTLAALDWPPMPLPPAFLKSFPLGLGPRRLGRSPAMKQWLLEAKLRGVDLFHNHSLWMMPNVYPGQVARKYNIPYVVSPHGTFTEYAMTIGSKIKRVFWPLVQRPALNAVSLFHATAESEYADIRRQGFRQPVAVIPNGIDLPEFLPKQSIGLRTLLFLGRIHPNKGLDMLLPAWKAVQDRFTNWRLYIVGPNEGCYLSQMQKQAHDLSLRRVEFAGPLYANRKWQAYADADLFILPSYSENFGMAVAEALATGTPAIVSKGAPWRGLQQRRAGWWIDIGLDPLVACLNEALSQTPDTLNAMGQRGRSWMEEEFSWSRLGQQMAETYSWILSGGTKPEWVIEG